MKSKIIFILALIGAISLLPTAFAQGTAFTYQGRLNANGAAASGSYDLVFTLCTSNSGSGSLLAGPVTNTATGVTNGLFTVMLDFGTNFPGAARWLEMGVRTNQVNAVSFSTLSPRQQITPTPYAVTAATVSGAVNVSQLSGSIPATNLSGTLAPAQLPAGVITNGGSGAGLTGVALLAGGNTFTGNQNFGSGSVSALKFVGSGSNLTGVVATSVKIPSGMALIPEGVFTIGNSIGDLDITNASPTNVFVSGFYMDVNLVSISQWLSVYYWATNHGYTFNYVNRLRPTGNAPNQPVYNVNWYDAVKWCNARSEQAGLYPVYYTSATQTTNNIYRTGETDLSTNYVCWARSGDTSLGYRLPTEAEWEKAARGGLSSQRFPWGNWINENLANCSEGSGHSYDGVSGIPSGTSAAGYYAPNGYGLYDMAGNLSEWCWNTYAGGYSVLVNPIGPGPAQNRVFRGGSWNNFATLCRSANRNSTNPVSVSASIGFRSVLAPAQ